MDSEFCKPWNGLKLIPAPPPATSSTGAVSPAARATGNSALLDTIGAGAFGTVWLARDEQLERDMADARQAESRGKLRQVAATAQLQRQCLPAWWQRPYPDSPDRTVSRFPR